MAAVNFPELLDVDYSTITTALSALTSMHIQKNAPELIASKSEFDLYKNSLNGDFYLVDRNDGIVLTVNKGARNDNCPLDWVSADVALERLIACSVLIWGDLS